MNSVKSSALLVAAGLALSVLSAPKMVRAQSIPSDSLLTKAATTNTVSLSTVAYKAQTKDVTLLPRTWSLKLGFFNPSNGNLKSQSGSLWWYGGFDYFPNFRYRPLKGDVHFGLDASWRSSKLSDFHIISASIKLIWPITPTDSSIRVWGGIGAGIYFIDTAFIGNTTQGGAKLIGGVDITDRVFLEVNYDWVSRFTDNQGNGLSADGLTVAFGYRL